LIHFVGVDPGKDGAIVGLDEHGALVTMTCMPVVGAQKRLYDVQEVASLIYHLWQGNGDDSGLPPVWFIEKQQPLPSKMGGAIANYQRGYALALFEGALAAARVPYHVISPGTWQKTMLRDVSASDTKARAYIVAQRLFPNVEWRKSPLAKKPHDGLVDAALIGVYGWRWTQGTT
jgi:hypothetical protein